MISRKAALAAIALVAVAMFYLGFVISQSFTEEIIQSNDCNTAWLRISISGVREQVPETEIKRVCGNNPEFLFTTSTSTP